MKLSLRFFPILPILTAGILVYVGACTEDSVTPGPSGPDASNDVVQPDPIIDATPDTKPTPDSGKDGGGDADAAGDAGPVAFCKEDTEEHLEADYLGTSTKILELASADCKIGKRFVGYDDEFGVPQISQCLGLQLLAEAGCKKKNKKSYLYDKDTTDYGGSNCLPTDATLQPVLVGFLDPKGVTGDEFELYLTYVKAGALAKGWTAADAEKLVDRVRAHRDDVVKTQATGFPETTCSG